MHALPIISAAEHSRSFGHRPPAGPPDVAAPLPHACFVPARGGRERARAWRRCSSEYVAAIVLLR